MIPKDPDKETVGNRGGARRPLGRWWMVALAVCLLGLGTYAVLARMGKAPIGGPGGEHRASAPGVAVVTAEAKKADFNTFVAGLGSVTPLNAVTVRTRVDGQLMEVLFREGQLVSRGERLARIDPRPFEVQLLQAEGQMARDIAQLKNAQLDLERFKTLWEQDSVARQQLDTQEALVRQLEGAIKTDQGQIDAAKLNLVYCDVTAPISGRVGLRLIDPGNIVHVGDVGGLVVIAQLQPIGVIFPIAEDSLPQVLAGMRADARLPAEIYNRDMSRKLGTGTLLTVDNQIDPTTGTVRLKAVFPNTENELFPNQFVNVRLLVNTLRKATVIPAPAIQRGPQGAFVYVVKPDRTATVRPITVGEIQGGEASVTSGLAPGEIVVVDGADRLREGVRVEPRTAASVTATAPKGQ